VQGPGPHDVIAFELDAKAAGKTVGISHFGFPLVEAKDIRPGGGCGHERRRPALEARRVRASFPFAYVADPDGYEIEIWYE